VLGRTLVISTFGQRSGGSGTVAVAVQRSPIALGAGAALFELALLWSVLRLVRDGPAHSRAVAGVSVLVGFSAGVCAIAATLRESTRMFSWIEGRPRRQDGRRVAAIEFEEADGTMDSGSLWPEGLAALFIAVTGLCVVWFLTRQASSMTGVADRMRALPSDGSSQHLRLANDWGLLAFTVTVAAVVVMLRGWRDLVALLGAAGAVLLALGCGLGGWVVVADASAAGRATARLDRSMPFAICGAGLLAIALVWSVARTKGHGPVALVIVLAGLAVAAGSLAATMSELHGFARPSDGRPRRMRGRRACRGFDREPDGPRWPEMAESEAESVGAFLDLAARLEAVGADQELIDRCFAAADDERRHARLCDRHAGLFAPRPEPAAEPDGVAAPRSLAIAQLAIESYVDGVVGEGMAAERIERWAGAASDPTTSRVLRSIARDERRHAQLAADIVSWCAAQHPRLVRALMGMAARRVATGAGRLPREAATNETSRRRVARPLPCSSTAERKSGVDVGR
jgi:rubrerythrin